MMSDSCLSGRSIRCRIRLRGIDRIAQDNVAAARINVLRSNGLNVADVPEETVYSDPA